jgi:hypothetical protein
VDPSWSAIVRQAQPQSNKETSQVRNNKGLMAAQDSVLKAVVEGVKNRLTRLVTRHLEIKRPTGSLLVDVTVFAATGLTLDTTGRYRCASSYRLP